MSGRPMTVDGRIERERRTISAMVRLYCVGHHDCGEGACPECQDLLDYAFTRLDRCPYQESKPTCARCPVHCYRPEMRERVRAVMRYSGPRMLVHHPVLAMRHLIDGRKRA